VRCSAAAALAALMLAAVALTGCETTAERSAQLARQAHHLTLNQRGLIVARVNPNVKVLGATLLHDANGTAAAVTLLNTSSRALRSVPIAITVRDARGSTLFQNNAPGIEASLVSVALLAPHAKFTWIDDQVQAAGAPSKLTARVGDASPAPAHPPQLEVRGVHLVDDPVNGVGAEGIVINRSAVAQQNLVVFGVARRLGRIVAAGRAVLPEVAGGSSSPFQMFFVGDPHGAQLQVSAPATTQG
jgi:hypothetical protein